MSQLNINLPDDVARRLRERAAREGHETIEEFVQALLRAEADEDYEDHGGPPHLSFETDDAVESFLEERMKDDGGTIEATPEFWEDLKRQFEERRQRKTI